MREGGFGSENKENGNKRNYIFIVYKCTCTEKEKDIAAKRHTNQLFGKNRSQMYSNVFSMSVF